jgi:pilus assembly protein CpaE
MVYSASTDSELLVRCMRAGAREFLTQPFAPGTIAEAMVRASVRRPTARPQKKTAGKLFVFLGAKGGSGVTTLACNFAVSLASESSQNTLLIDLHLPLGDAALDLGITAQYSTVNALQNASRLDSNFLSRLLTKHSSGLSVLAAPGKFAPVQTIPEEIDKLLQIARQDFDYVVVDAGTRLDLADTTLFDQASTIYLITQVSIPELRNSNRLVSEFFTKTSNKLEIVLNRFTPRSLGVDEEHITKALTRPATWRVPNDYATARRTQNTATPLSLEDSPISRVIRQMARTASGLPPNPEKKKRFGIFG